MRLATAAPAFAALLLFAGGAVAQAPRTTAPTATAAPANQRDPEAIAALERDGRASAHDHDLRRHRRHHHRGGARDRPVDPIYRRDRPDRAAARPASRQSRFVAQAPAIFLRRPDADDLGAAPGLIIPRSRRRRPSRRCSTLASDRLDLVIPFADLFEFGVNPELTSRITSGFLVGTEAVDDQTCTHYAFRQPDVDWEIWIREGDQPLPCMYRITDLRDPARPDYTGAADWDLNAGDHRRNLHLRRARGRRPHSRRNGSPARRETVHEQVQILQLRDRHRSAFSRSSPPPRPTPSAGAAAAAADAAAAG